MKALYLIKRLLVFSFLLLWITDLHSQDLLHIRLDSINSAYDEFNPVLSPDGQTLYVTRRGHAANVAGVIDQGDIWYANKLESGWSGLKHAGPIINHQGLNGVVGFSLDGNRMYLLNYFEPNPSGGGSLRQGIAVSTWTNGRWSSPEKLAIKYFQNKSNHLSATISKDEKVLILSMESFSSEGNEDLYVSFRQENGQWSEPQNLGMVVNTYAEEWTPFLASDNRTLYFSSNGFEGYGSRDVYRTKRQGDTWTEWSKPLNLGKTLNTEGVEMSFFVPLNADQGFFSTTQNSEGMGDIFKHPLTEDLLDSAQEELIVVAEEIIEVNEPLIDPSLDSAFKQITAEQEQMPVQEVVEEEVVLDTTTTVQEIVAIDQKKEDIVPVLVEPVADPEPKMVQMTFLVLDARTKQAVEAEVQVLWASEELNYKTSDYGSDRPFAQSFEEGTPLQITIKAEDYLDFETQFKASDSPLMSKDNNGSSIRSFLLTRKEVGASMRIKNVLFVRGTASFRNAQIAHVEIDKLVELMRKNPQMQIRLEGHTDNRGEADVLKSLSEERVKTVRKYMVSQGIEEDRIEAVGYGGEMPIAPNDSPASRAINRRVEFVIIK